MKLTHKNLDQYGWLFAEHDGSGFLVREHEVGGGKWDVEVDEYNLFVNQWDFAAPGGGAATVADLIVDHPWLKGLNWIPGDKVKFA